MSRYILFTKLKHLIFINGGSTSDIHHIFRLAFGTIRVCLVYAPADPIKILVMSITSVWFVAIILAVYRLLGMAFTNCCQFFG
jgi:hypothetical protein